ncbi:MAG: TRAP transporter small permease [Alphaproteobacteria bacterium]
MLERAMTLLARACTVGGALAIAVMMIATCWDIAARWIANAPLHGVVEMVEIMVLASAMLGLPEAFLRGDQITVDVIDGLVPPSILAILKIAATLLSAAFLTLLLIDVYRPMADAMLFGDVKPDLGVPVYPLYGVIIFGFGASALACLVTLLRQLGGGRRR